MTRLLDCAKDFQRTNHAEDSIKSTAYVASVPLLSVVRVPHPIPAG